MSESKSQSQGVSLPTSVGAAFEAAGRVGVSASTGVLGFVGWGYAVRVPLARRCARHSAPLATLRMLCGFSVLCVFMLGAEFVW